MRVAYVCADPGVPIFGSKGCSIHVQEIAREMFRRGMDVEFIVARTRGLPPDDWKKCRVRILPISDKLSAIERENEQIRWNDLAIEALEQGSRYDLIYERYSLWSASAMIWAKARGIPSILEVNAPLIEEQATHRCLIQHERARELTRQAINHAGMAYAVSEGIVPYLRQFLPADRAATVIPNGVNVSRFSPAVPACDPFHGITFGFVGSLKPWHGVDTLLAAFAQLSQRGETASDKSPGNVPKRLLIVGDGPERAKLEATVAANANLRSRVKFVGAVDPCEVPAWMNSMDVAVAPYPHSGSFYFSPLKIYEYMAAGRVVVASRVGQIADVVQHGINGWLVQAGDVSALATALNTLCGDPALRSRLAIRAREHAVKHSWSRVLDQVLQQGKRRVPDRAMDFINKDPAHV